MSKSQAAAPAADDHSQLLAKLQAENAELKASIAAGQSGGASGGGGPKAALPMTKGNIHRFHVTARTSAVGADGKSVPVVEEGVIQARDESEAIQRFCIITPDGQERQPALNPSSYTFKAVCIDADRAKSILKQYTDAATSQSAYIPLAIQMAAQATAS